MKVEDLKTVSHFDTDTITDSADVAFLGDTIANVSCIQNQEMFKDFRFVTERYADFDGPEMREVMFVGGVWNFVVLFVVMILMVINKFYTQSRFIPQMSVSFQNTGSEKIMRENSSFVNIVSLSTIISFVLLLSLFVQRTFLIYGNNRILHDNMNFYVDVAVAVAMIFVMNYLLVLFYGWLFKAETLLFVHVNLHVSAMSADNLMLLPMILILLFYPYKAFLVIGIIIMAILYIIRLVKFFNEVRMLPKLNFVNIFLYLCTIEILPVVVIVKMIWIVM